MISDKVDKKLSKLYSITYHLDPAHPDFLGKMCLTAHLMAVTLGCIKDGKKNIWMNPNANI